MEPLYNIYYAGEILEGQDGGAVRAKLAALFNASEATLDKLFSGTPQLLKRDCDKATALKYKQAMEKAGARPVIRKAGESAPAAPAPAEPETQRKLSTAERIAALAAAPDVGYRETAQPAAAPPAAQEAAAEGGLSAAPPTGDLLRPEERSQPVVREIDVSALSAESSYGRLAAAMPAPPPAPDTSHLQLGEAGESIPNLSPQAAPLAPDISSLELSPEGTDFSDCAGPEAEAPLLDLSAIDIAPAGSDVLEAQYRRRHDEPAPDTSHIQLEN